MALELKGGVISPASVTCDNCPVRTVCKFHQKRMGGFKAAGARARNVGYRLITDATDGHSAKEDISACFRFVEVMQPRMDYGRQRREAGKDGEIISIIAQEGEEIEQRLTVGINSRGEVIKPQAEIISALKANKIPHNLDDRSQAVEWKDIALKIKVPKFTGATTSDSYNQRLYERERAEQRAVEEGADDAWEKSQARTHTPARAVPTVTPVRDEGGAG